MKKSKCIAIFSSFVYPHLGGIENYTNNFSKELVKNGYKVIIISSNYDNSNNYIEEDNIINIKLPVYSLFKNRYPIIKKNNEYKSLIKKLYKYEIDAIIVNARFYFTSLIGARYGKKNNIPVFLIEHGSQHLTVDNKVLDFFGKIYEHLFTSIIKRYVNYYYGVSPSACLWQKHFNITSNGIWYNSINDFVIGLDIKKNKNNVINILYAGRIIKQKGVVELLESFEKLSKKYDNIYLTIAGKGNLLVDLKEKYNNKKITFLGKIDFEELKMIYAKTDIFVYAPKWPEGLPTSILEAGLTRCALITSAVPGIRELVDDNKDCLMVNNEKELVYSLDKLINSKELRTKLANNLEKKVRNNYLWSKNTKKMIDDIESVGNIR